MGTEKFKTVIWTYVCFGIITGLVVISGAAPDQIPLVDSTVPDWIPTKNAVHRGGYWMEYDGEKRSARYVVEMLTDESLSETGVGRGSGFRTDVDVLSEARAVDSDYRGSGYDRGHLAASANHHLSRRDQIATFRLSNTAPQTPECNRGPWKAIEDEVRDLVDDRGGLAIVVTAPLYIPDSEGRLTIQTIGRNRVWIPTHFGKTIIHYVGDESRYSLENDRPDLVKTWIIPNTPTPGTPEENLTTVDAFESALGIDVFSFLRDDVENRIEKQ